LSCHCSFVVVGSLLPTTDRIGRFPIARLRYTKTKRQWSLYWRDRNLRFHLYEPAPATSSVEDLLAEVDCDPTGISWG